MFRHDTDDDYSNVTTGGILLQVKVANVTNVSMARLRAQSRSGQRSQSKLEMYVMMT